MSSSEGLSCETNTSSVSRTCYASPIWPQAGAAASMSYEGRSLTVACCTYEGKPHKYPQGDALSFGTAIRVLALTISLHNIHPCAEDSRQKVKIPVVPGRVVELINGSHSVRVAAHFAV